MQQSVLPHEVVLVDASDQKQESSMREVVEPCGVRAVYLSSEPGRTRQLNLGARASNGDPIFFIDDDVELDGRFHEMMLAAFEAGGPEVGGLQGRVIDDTYGSLPKRIFRTVFLLSRHTKDSRGRMLPSGYYTTPARPTEAREVQALRLCGLAFRRHIFDEFAFDESLDGYALKEDADFSYRVSRHYKLLVVPDAGFRHFKSPTSRVAVRDKSRMHIVNNYRLFRKNLAGTPLQWLAFGWAMLGRMIGESWRAGTRRNPDYIYGTLDGLKEVLRSRDAG
jgi:GT2 family glycosyltransferase